MSNSNTDWSRSELRAYLLLYCANANFIKTKEETEQIRSKIDKTLFNKISKEFEGDNDYQSIQKIESAIKRLKYNKEEINALEDEIKGLFLADGNYDQMEKTLFFGLNKILN